MLDAKWWVQPPPHTISKIESINRHYFYADELVTDLLNDLNSMTLTHIYLVLGIGPLTKVQR